LFGGMRLSGSHCNGVGTAQVRLRGAKRAADLTRALAWPRRVNNLATTEEQPGLSRPSRAKAKPGRRVHTRLHGQRRPLKSVREDEVVEEGRVLLPNLVLRAQGAGVAGASDRARPRG